jgi:hypothetical protein
MPLRYRDIGVNTLLKRAWTEDAGVLSFEWILLITIVVIGIVGGLSAARDALIDELGDVAGAAISIDQSYTVAPSSCDLGNAFGYEDSAPNFGTCDPSETNVSVRRSSGHGANDMFRGGPMPCVTP